MPSSYYGDSLFTSVYYKNRTGVLSDLRDFYADIITTYHSKHTFGAKIYSEQETSLFTKNKIEAIYALQLKLNRHIVWSLGTQFGYANISFGASDASAGGSAWAFDGAISSTIKIQKTEFALALHQLPKNQLQPIQYTFVLQRYLESYLCRDFQLSPHFDLTSGISLKINTSFHILEFDNKLSYDKIGLLLKIANNNIYSLGVFLKLPYISKNALLSASYNSSFQNQNLRNNWFSIGLNIGY